MAFWRRRTRELDARVRQAETQLAELADQVKAGGDLVARRLDELLGQLPELVAQAVPDDVVEMHSRMERLEKLPAEFAAFQEEADTTLRRVEHKRKTVAAQLSHLRKAGALDDEEPTAPAPPPEPMPGTPEFQHKAMLDFGRLRFGGQ